MKETPLFRLHRMMTQLSTPDRQRTQIKPEAKRQKKRLLPWRLVSLRRSYPLVALPHPT